MSAMSGLVGQNPPGPSWGHLRQFFPWTEKQNDKMLPIFPWWALAAVHPGWGNSTSITMNICWAQDVDNVLISKEENNSRPHLEIPIAPPQVDSSKGPHRVNRAHWPTQENGETIRFF